MLNNDSGSIMHKEEVIFFLKKKAVVAKDIQSSEKHREGMVVNAKNSITLETVVSRTL